MSKKQYQILLKAAWHLDEAKRLIDSTKGSSLLRDMYKAVKIALLSAWNVVDDALDDVDEEKSK